MWWTWDGMLELMIYIEHEWVISRVNHLSSIMLLSHFLIKMTRKHIALPPSNISLRGKPMNGMHRNKHVLQSWERSFVLEKNFTVKSQGILEFY